MAADGQSVFSAGEAGWVYDGIRAQNILVLDDRSGHYHPTRDSVLNCGLQAWLKNGYRVEFDNPTYKRQKDNVAYAPFK